MLSCGSAPRRSVMSATMKGCEIVLSKPIGSGVSWYARGARKEGTKRCRGTLRIAASTRSSRAALPSSSLARSTWIPMTSTTIWPVIARVPKAPLVAFRKWWIGLEIGARQVIEQHVVADIEQIAPPPHQMIEDRLLVHQQPVVTAVQLVDFRQPGTFAQQVGQRAALKPLTMQAPLAAGRQQAVGNQHEQHLIPMRSFAAHSQPL